MRRDLTCEGRFKTSQHTAWWGLSGLRKALERKKGAVRKSGAKD